MNPNDFCILTAAASRNPRMIALSIALDALGCQERPGHNVGVIVRAVMDGREGEAYQWCAGFATRCYILAYQLLGRGDPFIGIANRFSSSALYRWAQVNDKLTTEPRNGDLFLVKGGSTGHSHTGIVATADKPDFITIEGNIKDRVIQRELERARVDFIRVCGD
jgi:hypothetical protein